MKLLVLMVILFGIACGDSNDTTIQNGGELETPDCSETSSVFTINLEADQCDVDIQSELGLESLYQETVSGSTRSIRINGIASHYVGEFPNNGNPNTISSSTESFLMTTEPSLANRVTYGRGYTFGVLFSGVAVDPYTAEFFQGSNGTNMEWSITTLQSTRNLGLDCNNAHVQPTGRYHYHGTPSNYIDGLDGADGTQMIKIGYAGDGYPIYYKYGYAEDETTIIAMDSGYKLKTEERGGDGLSAPDGCPDGYYFNDYEYDASVSVLDECNGRMGKTPESDNEYYYVITDNFPSSPLCFSGTPDDSFSFF